MTEAPAEKRRLICLDTNIVIYLLEGSDDPLGRLTRLLQAPDHAGSRLMVSQIAVAECLYGANKRGDAELVRLYGDLFFGRSLIDVAPLTMDILLKAASIGPALNLKLVDALHFNSALAAGADAFITNDARFKTAYGLNVVPFSSLA